MSLVFANLVQESSTTQGVTDFELAGAITDYRAFGSFMSDGDQTYYVARLDDEWEEGLGTYVSSTDTLQRTTVFRSSNSNNKVSFSSGTKTIGINVGLETLNALYRRLDGLNTGPLAGRRNMIINGAMVVNQRGSTVTGDSGFPVDRFEVEKTATFDWTCEQSTESPAGFTHSLKVTAGTPAAAGASDYAIIRQRIEGLNTAWLQVGASGAATVTASVRVRSSVTGTYGVFLTNDDGNRSYVTDITINSADTWEAKTVTLTLDTTGTWKTDTSTGIEVGIALMAGSNFQGTDATWEGAQDYATSSISNAILNYSPASPAPTFYTTGWQFEYGSYATDFERVTYASDLMACHRYFQGGIPFASSGYADAAGQTAPFYAIPQSTVEMRDAVVVENQDIDAFGNITPASFGYFTPTTKGAVIYLQSGNAGRTYWRGRVDYNAEL
ncbi:hypothetical protein [Rhodobium gokarnense]|uniref:Uncharacterized protein n=1 Tax=Rhodobium gokarnense TaxID=364296 RepID=A0ABT3HH60_9HYPH|nr:hypothetical protein [Rhodobium gokarnense]MCW2309750.1 hypothetical protein [Rhodobium gokarnense]